MDVIIQLTLCLKNGQESCTCSLTQTVFDKVFDDSAVQDHPFIKINEFNEYIGQA